MTVLVLMPQGKNDRRESYVRNTLGRFGIRQIIFTELNKKFKFWQKRENGKNVYQCAISKRPEVARFLADICKKFQVKLIISFCDGSNTLLLYPQLAIDHLKSAKFRGSTFSLETPLPQLLIIDDPAKCYTRTSYQIAQESPDDYDEYGNPKPAVDDADYADFIFMRDAQKIARIYRGEPRRNPRFNYTLVEDISTLRIAERFLNSCFIISSDIETIGSDLSCSGYTGINDKFECRTFVIPVVNPSSPGWVHWQTTDEFVEVFQTMQRINRNPAPKVFHNGSYDNAILMRYHCEVKNFLIDTMHLMHSLHPYARKSLGFTASIYNDEHTYWKDDIKGNEADADTKEYSIPYTRSGLEIYWRYCGLDTWNTLVCAIHLLAEISEEQNKWAENNYILEFSIQMGPAMLLSMHGLVIDTKAQDRYIAKQTLKADKALEQLRIASDKPDFNPNSSAQVAEIVYDVLGVIPEDGKTRSVDKKQLRFLSDDNPFLAKFCSWLWNYKEGMNSISKYRAYDVNAKTTSGLRFWRGRFLSAFSIAATYTSRFGSKSHHFWVGTNAQNIPGDARSMFRADNGYFYLECDYGQSDNYFVAFESNDQLMIDTVLDDRDTHSVHCETILQVPYDTVVAWNKVKDPRSDHPITGVRQITKKVTHGSNYGMEYKTMYVNVGKIATVAAAKALGLENVEKLSRHDLENVCKLLQVRYNSRYVVAGNWRFSLVDNIYNNNGLISCYGGRTHKFLLHHTKKARIKREASGFKGQGGTAGNINLALLRFFYYPEGRKLIREGVTIVLQVHDSLSFQIPLTKPWLGNNCIDIMHQPCTINNRTFTVPIEAEASLFWTKKGKKWPHGISAEDAVKLVSELKPAT